MVQPQEQASCAGTCLHIIAELAEPTVGSPDPAQPTMTTTGRNSSERFVIDRPFLKMARTLPRLTFDINAHDLYVLFQMETNRLKQFCLIVEMGSLTRAAELLGVSHSGLSKSMKVLQEELRSVLFHPRGRGLAVTPAGRKTYEHAKTLLASAEQLLSGELLQQEPVLRIGMVEIFLHGFVRVLRARSLGGAPLQLMDVEPGEMERRILSRDLDFGVTYAPSANDELDVLELGRYHLGCFHLRGPLERLALTELPFAVPASMLSSNALGIKDRDGWLQGLLPRTETFRVNLLSVALDLALQGLCAVYIPRFVAHGLNQTLGSEKLVERALPNEARQSRRAFVLKRQEHPEDAQFKRFCSLVRQMLRGSPQSTD
jgi:DNA-binding transcriptional LysR family regulator